jgi:predicted ferric reductase
VPGRALSILIGIFVIINVVFSGVNFESFSPNTWFASPQFELCEYVGNRTGTLSLVNMSIALLFAGRNNLLIALTGWNQTAFLTLHRWAARVGAVQAVVHSIVYTLAYFEPGRTGASDYAAMAAEPFYVSSQSLTSRTRMPPWRGIHSSMKAKWFRLTGLRLGAQNLGNLRADIRQWWGIIATIAFCLAICFAILPIRTRFYEMFLVVHIVLVILLLVGCWYHLVPHFGFVYGYQVWLCIAFAFWAFDRVTRFVRVLYYNRFGNTAAIAQAIPGCDIIEITIFPQVDWNFGPGQHSFLYLPGLHRPWQSHPFSIAGWRRKGEEVPSVAPPHPTTNVDEEKVKESEIAALSEEIYPKQDTTVTSQQRPIQNLTRLQGYTEIRFLMRVHKGMTSALQRQLLSTPSGHNADLSGYIEGPYAGHRATLQPLIIADTVICITGGIGITNALGFIQEYVNAHQSIQQAGENVGQSRGIMKKAKRFVLAWSAREMALIDHVKRSFLAPHGDVAGIEYSLWCTGTPDPASRKLGTPNDEQNSETGVSKSGLEVTVGRMKVRDTIRSVLEPGLRTTVLVCGPGNMVDEATREVVNYVKDGFKVDMIEEAYAW